MMSILGELGFIVALEELEPSGSAGKVTVNHQRAGGGVTRWKRGKVKYAREWRHIWCL